MADNKTISMAKLDAAIDAVRIFYVVDSSKEHASAMFDACERAMLGKDASMYSLCNVISGIVGGPRCLGQDATNEDIYKVLEVLGWSVIEEDSDE